MGKVYLMVIMGQTLVHGGTGEMRCSVKQHDNAVLVLQWPRQGDMQ
jgi:hypothetical protein